MMPSEAGEASQEEVARNRKHPFVAEAGNLAVEAPEDRSSLTIPLDRRERHLLQRGFPRGAGNQGVETQSVDPAVRRLGGT